MLLKVGHNRVKALLVCGATVMVGAVGIREVTQAGASERKAPMHNHNAPDGLKTPQRPVTVHRESGPFIDGAQTPELIPDDVAYSLFLRMLSARDQNPRALARQRSYLKHVLRGADAIEGSSDPGTMQTNADVETLLRFEESYEARLRTLDTSGGSKSDEVALVAEIVGTMPYLLGQRLATKIDRYVKKQFKRNVKIIL
jgi:hypothetical protein